MVDKYGTGQDPYCYRNSQVLKNLLGIRDEEILESAERELTEIAVQNLEFSEPPYDYAYLKFIHKTLFTDILYGETAANPGPCENPCLP